MAKDQKLGYFRVSTIDGTLVDSRILEDSNGRMKSVQMVDLNGDGQKQLLFNNYEYAARDNGIWVYTIPDDLKAGEFKRHDISLGFPSASQYYLNRISAPGYPFLFYPKGEKSGRAHILVAGHGNMKVWLLCPTGDASKFEYERHEILDGGAVIVDLAITNLNADDKQQVFVGNFQKGYVDILETSTIQNE